MLTTTVRRAIVADAGLLHEIAQETFSLACPPTTTQEAIAAHIAEHLSQEAFVGYLRDPSRELLIGEVAGHAAGYVLFCHEAPSDPDVVAVLCGRPTLELSKCYVRAGYHGAGVASALVAAGIASARTAGFAALWLGVNQLNDRANRFYDKMGFRLVGTKKFLVGQRYEDDFVRELILDEPS